VEGVMNKYDDTPREAALAYMQKTGFDLSDTKRMVKAYLGLKGCTLCVNSSSTGEGSNITIDDNMVDRLTYIQKGLNEISKEARE
jgi:hypothetical protein